MIEVLEFIFQNFWHWLGTVILVSSIGGIFRFKVPIIDQETKKY